MESGFSKANSTNLPKIDAVMLGTFFASNSDFCSSEFRNVKTSMSSRASYGDDAVSYVQLKRDANLCTVKCKICPEHKVHAKLYGCTMIIDEGDDVIVSVECDDCVASKGGCKHAIAFLFWVHRRSEEPSCTSTECYWKKSKLSRVGSSIKFISAKEMSKGSSLLPANQSVLSKFLEEGRNRKVQNCELLKYQPNYSPSATEALSMHQLVLKLKEQCVNTFLSKICITSDLIEKVKEETRDQSKSNLWFELRYGRITASRAFEVSRCKVGDGTLVSLILGGKIPDTKHMKRGRMLEDQVCKTVEAMLNKKIKKCGLVLSSQYPMIAGSPDGVCDDCIIEIKCPVSIKTYKNYIKNGQATEKYNAQMQLQMYLTGKKTGFFCVADPDYERNKKVDVISVKYNHEYVEKIINDKLIVFWKNYIYPLLYKNVI
ncbi:unnamed protein product [Chrysodeixis includens]|uniref:YqaJ viral recombinase domain-containing protein n=1 Tax=Chrysodeixis includens TaxID=689277 RepID=A0A9N8L135_CHRIL|nr:unnamed protein product [Chrysodeixis includens]